MDQPVTLVCAPAGFGKSTLVSQWCAGLDSKVAWLSLDPVIDNPQWFLLYLVTAVRQVLPDSLQTVSQMAAAGQMPTEQAVVVELSNELEELPEPLVIVLDDYHALTSEGSHRIIGELLKHPPASVQFVIVARYEPPLPIASLRASNHMSEVRMAELSFTEDEIRCYTDRELDRTLTDEQVSELHQSTEGWPAGLRFAIEGLRLKVEDASIGPGFLDQAAQEYLLAEVLDRLPPPVRRYLLVTSHFDRFSAELCDAVITHAGGRQPLMDGAEFIAWLRSHDLFIIPLDDEGVWFRFHHLFGRLLREWAAGYMSELDWSEVQIRQAAAQVFQGQRLIEEAIEQLYLAGDHADVMRLVGEVGDNLIEEERWTELARLVERVPDELIDEDPAILVLRAWQAGEVQSRFLEMNELLDRAEGLLGDGTADEARTRWVLGQILELRGAYAKLIHADFDGAVADADEAMRLLADTPGRHLTFAIVLKVLGLAGAGQSEAAHELARSVVGDPRFADAPFHPMAWSLPYLGWLEGDLASEEQHATQLLAIGQKFGLADTVATAHYFLGTSAYERNRLEEAETHLSAVLDARYVTQAVNPIQSGMALALAELALGRPADAEATAQAMMQQVLDMNSEFLQPAAMGFMAELDLRQGRRQTSALRWARTANSDVARHRFLFYDPEPTRLEVLLASEPDAERGREELEDNLISARGRHHRPVLIRLLGIKAVDLARRGNEAEALAILQEAVAISQDGGIIRRLADLGPPLVPLLHRLDVEGPLLEHVGAILAAIEPPPRESSSEVVAEVRFNATGRPALTDREASVLRLLANRYSNKEIAQELVIAPATVKKHTVTLYDKLNVHGRREAVAKARTLGYLRE